MVDHPSRHDLAHDLVGVVRPIAALKAQREGERRGQVVGRSGRESVRGVCHDRAIAAAIERSKNHTRDCDPSPPFPLAGERSRGLKSRGRRAPSTLRRAIFHPRFFGVRLIQSGLSCIPIAEAPKPSDRFWPLEAEVAQGEAGVLAARAAAKVRRAHSDRRQPARLVRGPGAALSLDRVHRRRDGASDRAAHGAGGVDEGLSRRAAPPSLGVWAAAGALLGSSWRLSRQRQRSFERRRQDRVVTERLRIEQICALTPQAKGRVERANQTLQDRLVKETRLRNVSSVEEAEAFFPQFIASFNAKFAVAPQNLEDAHRPLRLEPSALEEVLARREERVLTKALTFSCGGVKYAVKTKGPGLALRGAKITLLHFM